MAINANIPLMAKGIDTRQMLENGSQLADMWLKQKTDAEMTRIYNEAQGDVDKMLGSAQQSKLARWIVPQIQAQQAERQKALLANQKAQSEIMSAQAQAQERIANAGKTGVETSNLRLNEAKKAIFAGAQNGNPQYIKWGLDAAKNSGAIDDATYQQYISQLSSIGNNPAQVAEWAKNAVLVSSKNPESFLFQTMDNAANNAQSNVNNFRSTNATLSGQETQERIAAANREQSDAHFQQQQYFQQNKPQKFIAGTDGYQYALFPDGTGMQVLGQDGQPIRAASKAETPIQKMEREDKVLGYVGAAQSAAKNANMAAELANDLGGLNSSTGVGYLTSRVPGSRGYAFAQRLETLKSNVFLQSVEQMRGLGALTDAEGMRLEKAVASLDIKQDPATLQRNLTEIAQMMNSAAQKANKRVQIYSGNAGTTSNPFMQDPSTPAQQADQVKLSNILFGQ